MLVSIMTCFLLGMLILFTGYLTWCKKKLFLIAGYDPKAYKGDKDQLARRSGLYSILVGLCTILLPFGLEYVGPVTGVLYGGIAFIPGIFLAVHVLRKQMG
ncbi:DUF3784 domain-containing protein [Halobacillus litoralis]|uniref:DUF3784 domain-containing protein n=1 Tax=Halobacillus litoralis TaxID=45668 RepID=UPI001CFED2F0|nr:DUF3784 domain-containing protein [Halobacillus litoralis]